MATSNSSSGTSQRLASLDFMRGLIMVLLALESAGLYFNMLHASQNSAWHFFWREFTHHPWHGLHFWDLIQPGFMFIAGTAMAFSQHKQQLNGVPWSSFFKKMLRRCGWLFFFGVLDYAVRPQGLSFELWDVLTQLSFTMLVAFLIFRWPVKYQIIFSIGLLILTEVLYRCINIPGFDQPFTDQHNFGNYIDLVLMNKINKDGWVAINCIPTAAHTIWGAVAGKILLSKRSAKQKMSGLLIGGLICLVLGFGLDAARITPIIKRIATSTFVLASGGWCLLGLAVCYWWIDILNHKKYLLLFTVVGMNSIFIYLFFEIIGDRWFNDYISAITNGLMSFANIPNIVSAVITSFCIFTLEWLLLYFLYRKKIFIKV